MARTPRNRRYADLLNEVNAAQLRRRSKRESISDLAVALVALFFLVVFLTYWGRHV